MKVNSLLTAALFSIAILSGLATSAHAQDAAEYDVRPMPVKTPPPAYPEELRRDGVKGLVAVRVMIDESGNVTEASISKSSHAGFEQAALTAIRGWKFKPASKGGAPVASKVVVPLVFNVEA
jgi:protein TonB